LKFTFAGDAAIQKVLPKNYDGFEEIRKYIAKGDVRFFNLETTVNENCFGNYFSGGTWLRTSPKVYKSVLDYGFNMTTFANNHCMDFSYDGLLQTLDTINETNIVNAGIGRNLGEAASPKYLDLPCGRVALISCSTDFAPGAMAGEQSSRVPGRPGINGINVKETLVLNKNNVDKLNDIAKETKINAYNEDSRKSGYLNPLPEGVFEFGKISIRLGESEGVEYTVDKSDIERIENSIIEAKFQADYVLLSFHTHYLEGADNVVVPKFVKNFARKCVDLGVDCFIGHGPHELRPMEIYNGKPIFYSIGDFILQLENIEYAPMEYYKNYGLTPDCNMYELFKTRTRNFTVGLQRDPVMMEAIIPFVEMDNGKLISIEFLPIELGYGMKHSMIGWPKPAKNNDIFDRFKAMCKPYGVEMKIEKGIGKIIF